MKGDGRPNALGPDQSAALVVVAAAIGQQPLGSSPRPPTRPRTAAPHPAASAVGTLRRSRRRSASGRAWCRGVGEHKALGALFTDHDHVVLVSPCYKDHLDVPGGYIEYGETPHEAAVREVAEELGIAPRSAGSRSRTGRQRGVGYHFPRHRQVLRSDHPRLARHLVHTHAARHDATTRYLEHSAPSDQMIVSSRAQRDPRRSWDVWTRAGMSWPSWPWTLEEWSTCGYVALAEEM